MSLISLEYHFLSSLMIFQNLKNKKWPSTKGTGIKTIHEVSGFIYVVISPYNPTKRETYRVPDAGKVFIEQILCEEIEILKQMDMANEPMIMMEVDQQKNQQFRYLWNKKMD